MKTKEHELIKMSAKRLSDEIVFDIEDGVYDHFEHLKARLFYIKNKLDKIHNVINADVLTENEINSLVQNDYWY